MHDAARFRARSTSHAVPQAPCRAVGGGPEFRLRRAGLGRMRPILNSVLSDRDPARFIQPVPARLIGPRRISETRRIPPGGYRLQAALIVAPRSRHPWRRISRVRPAAFLPAPRWRVCASGRPDAPPCRGTTASRPMPAGARPRAGPAGSSCGAAAECRLSACLVPARPLRSATVSAQARHGRPPAFGCRRATEPLRPQEHGEFRADPPRVFSNRAAEAGSAASRACAGSASRSASTALICASSSSSRSSSRRICAVRCRGKFRPSPVRSASSRSRRSRRSGSYPLTPCAKRSPLCN